MSKLKRDTDNVQIAEARDASIEIPRHTDTRNKHERELGYIEELKMLRELVNFTAFKLKVYEEALERFLEQQ